MAADYASSSASWDGDPSQAKASFQLPILLYHRVANAGPSGLAPWRVDPQMFARQLEHLKAYGYYTIGSDELLAAARLDRPLRGKPVMITFDDGYQDFLEVAWPLLKQKDFFAEVFIVTDKVGGTSDWDAHFGDPAPLMSWDSIAHLHSEGARFGSHLATHRRVEQLSPGELRYEGLKSRHALEHRLNRPINVVALPHGSGNEQDLDALEECGYSAQFGVTERIASAEDRLMDLPRVSVLGTDDIAKFDAKLRLTTSDPGN